MQRANELLRTMTVEEKAMQLSSVFPLALFNTEGTNRSQLDALLKNGIGHVSALGLIGHKTPEALAKHRAARRRCGGRFHNLHVSERAQDVRGSGRRW